MEEKQMPKVGYVYEHKDEIYYFKAGQLLIELQGDIVKGTYYISESKEVQPMDCLEGEIPSYDTPPTIHIYATRLEDGSTYEIPKYCSLHSLKQYLGVFENMSYIKFLNESDYHFNIVFD